MSNKKNDEKVIAGLQAALASGDAKNVVNVLVEKSRKSKTPAKTPEQVKADEDKKAEILAEMEATKAKASTPIKPVETLPGEQPDNPKFVKASIAARKKALADMAAAKIVDAADKKASAAEPPLPPLTKKARKMLEDAVKEKLTVVKKLVPKGTNAKRKMIKTAMNEFPATFAMVDYEGHKLTLSRDDSDADLKTEKVMLAICDSQGNVIAKHSPKMLHAIIIGGKKGSKSGKPKKPGTKKPHVKGERKTESNIPLMMRLLREGKTQEQIFTEFRSRYTEQNVEHKDEGWTWDRVVIYHKIAMGKLSKDERKAVPTTEINKPKKSKTEKAPKTGKPAKEGKKKNKTKTPKEPKPDGASKAERKAKQKAKAEASDSAFASKLAAAEAALEEAKKTKADGAVIVRLARELKELKESNEPCVACSGKGKSSKGNVCEPCKGTGKKGMAV